MRFKIIVDARRRKSGIAAKGNACALAPVTLDDRLEDALPIVGTVNVTGTKSTSLQITELVEDEERMVAGATKVAKSRCKTPFCASPVGFAVLGPSQSSLMP